MWQYLLIIPTSYKYKLVPSAKDRGQEVRRWGSLPNVYCKAVPNHEPWSNLLVSRRTCFVGTRLTWPSQRMTNYEGKEAKPTHPCIFQIWIKGPVMGPDRAGTSKSTRRPVLAWSRDPACLAENDAPTDPKSALCGWWPAYPSCHRQFKRRHGLANGSHLCPSRTANQSPP